MNKKLKSFSIISATLPIMAVVSCVNGKPNPEFVEKANVEQKLINAHIAGDTDKKWEVELASINKIDKNQNFTTDNEDGLKKAKQIMSAIGYDINWDEKHDEKFSYLFFIGNFEVQTAPALSSFVVNIRVIYNGMPNISYIYENGKDETVAPFKIEFVSNI